MNYICFLIKKVVKSKMTWIPLGLILLISLAFLFFNENTAKKNTLGVRIQEDIEAFHRNIVPYNEELKTLEEGTERFELVKATIKDMERRLRQNERSLEHYEKEEWMLVYQLKVEQLEEFKQTTKNLMENQWDIINREYGMYQSLLKANVPFESTEFPTKGVPFTLSLIRYIVPLLLSFGMIFILSNLYGSAYYEKINKNRLLPQKSAQIVLKNIGTGVIVASAALLGVLLISFIIASIFFGVGNLQYPVLHYDLITKSLYFAEIGKTILPTLILQTLSFVFIAAFTYLMTILCKNKMVSLFLTTLVVVGGAVLPSFIQPFKMISQYVPTTYLNSYDIATGVYQKSIEHFEISFKMGLVSLGISTIIVILLSILLQRKSKITVLKLKLSQV